MDNTFDFTALLRENETKHKCRPKQFVSVASGVQKRLESKVKSVKTTRLTIFDKTRNLERTHSPPPTSEALTKLEHRMQLLKKWKEEKEKKKMEAARNKKKPFLAGLSKYVPPPPPPPPKPSTSGRVTRSQSKLCHPSKQETTLKSNPKTKSFAPSNATFKAPELKTLTELPTLALPKKKSKQNFTFEPVLPPAVVQKVKPSRPKTLLRQNATETEVVQKVKPPRSKTVLRQNATKTKVESLPPRATTTRSQASTSQIQNQTTLGSRATKTRSQASTFQTQNQTALESRTTKARSQALTSIIENQTALGPRATTTRTKAATSQIQNQNALGPRATTTRYQASISQNQAAKTTKENVTAKQNVRSKVPVSDSTNSNNNFKRCLRDSKPVNTRNAKTSNAKNCQTSSSSSDVDLSNVKRIKKPKGQQKKTKELKSTSTEQSSDSSFDKVNSRLRSLRQFPDSLTQSDSDNRTMLCTETVPVNSIHIKITGNSSDTNPEHSEVTDTDLIDRSAKYTPEHNPEFKPVRCHIRTPKAKMIPWSESSSEEKLRSPNLPEVVAVLNPSPKTPKEDLTPEQVEKVMNTSPRVTVSRGKENARKEMMWKLDAGLMDEDTCEMESVTHFRKQLASEIERMTAMCDDWDKIFQQTVLPEPVQELVLSAVGQARLLMSQKLKQFASLIERCARPEPGTALVTPADLHGFWDMVFMQVENVDIRFKHLETLRARNWIEEIAPQQSKMAAKPRGAVKKPPKPAANSRLRDMIAAARKAKKDVASPDKIAPTPALEEKHFEAGFFSVRSPVRCSGGAKTLQTPQGRVLYRAVLSSEAKKASQGSASRNSASFAMLRASLMSKHVDCDGVAPLPQTPESTAHTLPTHGRSILKSCNKTATAASSQKCMKIVLFHDSDATENDAQDTNSETINKDSDVKQMEEETEPQTDSGTSSMDAENSDVPIIMISEPIKTTIPRLTRQEAITLNSPKTTEANSPTPENDENTQLVAKTPRRSTRKTGNIETTNKKNEQSGRKKLDLELGIAELLVRTPRRSKVKALQEIHANAEKKTPPQRITRSRRSAPTAF